MAAGIIGAKLGFKGDPENRPRSPEKGDPENRPRSPEKGGPPSFPGLHQCGGGSAQAILRSAADLCGFLIVAVVAPMGGGSGICDSGPSARKSAISEARRRADLRIIEALNAAPQAAAPTEPPSPEQSVRTPRGRAKKSAKKAKAAKKAKRSAKTGRPGSPGA